MDKYKDYIARTQQDRIFLDILSTLNEINEHFKNDKLQSLLYSAPIIPKVVTPEVKSEPKVMSTNKRGRKPKGDK